MAAATRDATSTPLPSRPLPLHLSQIAHIVRLICDARLPLHLGRKTFAAPDDGGLRVSSVRIFPEVESDVTAYMMHFRSPLYLCIGKPSSKSSPVMQPYGTHAAHKDEPPVRWPSTESDDQPYDMTPLELWCFKFAPHPSGSRAPHLPPQPRDICCLGRTLCAMLRLMPLFSGHERSELLYLVSSTIPPTTTPLSLKDSYDFGGPVDTEGGKLSVSVQFSRLAPRVSSRSTPSPAPSSFLSSSATASASTNPAARPPMHPSDGRDSKFTPSVPAFPPKRHSLSPGSAPESALISSAPRRNSLQPTPPLVGSLESPGSFGSGSRIFTPPVTVRMSGNVQPAGSSSATAVRAPSVSSNQYHESMGQAAAAGIAVAVVGPSPPQYVLASSMTLNASSIGSSSSFPAMSAGVDLLHAHTPRLALHELAAGGSVSRTSSAGSLGARELQPLSLAWEGGGMSSAKVTSSASQAGDNPFMLADSSDDDEIAGPGRMEDDDDGFSDSTFRFGAPALKLATALGTACSMQDVVDSLEPKGKIDKQLADCEELFKDLQHAAH